MRWAFRAVLKKDREGHLLDWQGQRVSQATGEKLRTAMQEPTKHEALVGKK